MLARHAFQLAAAHATRKPPEDHWAFLEEIDAPQWVDFTLEAALEGTEGDDPWFHQTHWHHETPLIHLVDQANSPDGYKSSQLETKKPEKLPTSPQVGCGDHVWKLQKTNNGQAWPRSQAKRVQPLCFTSQHEYDLERPCSTNESAMGKAPGFLHDGGEDESQIRRRFTCTSEQSVNRIDNVGFSVRESHGVLSEFSLESVGSCSSLTQVRRKYLSSSENDELQHCASGDEDTDLHQSATSVCLDIRELQTRPAVCPFVPVLAPEFSGGPQLGVEQIDVADCSTSELVELSDPECSDECSPATRKPIPDWSTQISLALKQSATNRLRKSWGGAQRVRQVDILESSTSEECKESGTMHVTMDDDIDDRNRKKLGGTFRVKQANLELSVDEDGKEAEATNVVAAGDDGRIRKSWGGAMRVKQDDIIGCSSGHMEGIGASNLDEPVDNGRMQKSRKGALRVKLENVADSRKGDAGTIGEMHLNVVVHTEKIQPDGNLDLEEEETSCLSELSDICLRNVGSAEMDMSNPSRVRLVNDRSCGLENLSDDSVVLNGSFSCMTMSIGESRSTVRLEGPSKICSSSCMSISIEESSSTEGKQEPLGEGPSKVPCKPATPVRETCKERTTKTALDAQQKVLLKTKLSLQTGARAKDGLKGRPPKGNKENLSLETGGKVQQSVHVTNKPRTACEMPKQQHKEVLRMSMPSFQPGEAMRRSAKGLGSEGSVRRSVLGGDRTKVRQDSGISKSGQMLVTNHALVSRRAVDSTNGQAGFRRSMSAFPADTTKRSASGVNKGMKGTFNSGLRTSMSQEKGNDLAALIAEHNRKVRPAPQYEPRLHSLRDIREWERRTGQKYYSLPAAERAKVNQELSALKGA